MNVSFLVKEVRYYNYCYNNGATKQVSRIESGYYLPIYKSYSDLILVRKEYRTYIQECIEINNKWETKIYEIKFTSCMWGMMLYDLFQKKVEKLSKNAIEFTTLDELNEYLNSELISIKREAKLKNLLNV